jgi:hypothetical protein
MLLKRYLLELSGGSVYAGLGIYDTMQYIKPDVYNLYRYGCFNGYACAAGAEEKFGIPLKSNDSPTRRSTRSG